MSTILLSEKEAADKLQQLNDLERRLSEALIRMKSEHGSNSKEVESLKAEAREKFGTDDLGELRALYRKNLEENSANILAFEQKLMNIQNLVDHANQKLSELGSN